MKTGLSTERLVLRPWREGDAESLFELARDPRVGPAAGWPPHRSVAESGEVIRTIFSAPETYAVVLRGTDRPVGCVGLLFGASAHFPIGASEAEAGYWVGTDWRGRGLIPEALGGLSRRAFGELGLTALWGCCFVGNRASRRVMEKCFPLCAERSDAARLPRRIATCRRSPVPDVRSVAGIAGRFPAPGLGVRHPAAPATGRRGLSGHLPRDPDPGAA